MDTGIIVAVISGLASIITIIISTLSQNKEIDSKLDKQLAVLDERVNGKLDVMSTKLENLKEEVKKHNNFAQRMPAIEEQITHLMEYREDIDEAISKLDKLEEKVSNLEKQVDNIKKGGN